MRTKNREIRKFLLETHLLKTLVIASRNTAVIYLLHKMCLLQSGKKGWIIPLNNNTTFKLFFAKMVL